MAVVVSDTTPLHYLILIGREGILEKLYGRVIVPPGVLTELTHASAPAAISRWARKPPSWVIVATPKTTPPKFDVLDSGERQALALAIEIHADLVLLDDKAARRVAVREGLNVKGTLGVIAEAARASLLDFEGTIRQLQETSIHLGQEVVEEIIQDYKRSSPQNREGKTDGDSR